MTDVTELKTLTIDGVEHELAGFSERVQRLVGVHQRWEKEQVEQQLDLAKTQAAVRDLARELIGVIKEELAAKAAANEETAATETPAA